MGDEGWKRIKWDGKRNNEKSNGSLKWDGKRRSGNGEGGLKRRHGQRKTGSGKGK